jgi:predicted ATPase/class 3 adenylate cyclase
MMSRFRRAAKAETEAGPGDSGPGLHKAKSGLAPLGGTEMIGRMPDRPTGTVTLFFTDIEGSTALLRSLGTQRYSEALERHRVLLRRQFDAFGGYEAGCEGDSFFVVFPSADAAVSAAEEIQRGLVVVLEPNEGDLRVRIGIHTGEPLLVHDHYIGIDVHQAARIMAAAHGGQVLLSETTALCLNDRSVTELGTHELKDIGQPIRLFQLTGDGLEHHFPPPRTLQNRPTNLPAHLTPLIGRTTERAEVAALLQNGARLVTLSGTGGTGKTRLALEIAADHREAFPDGVYFVDLSSITDSELVLPAIAQAIGISEGAGQSLVAYLKDKRILVVADNFEQVIEGARRVGDLLGQAPSLAILVTCRGPLRLRGEHVYVVSPLPIPDRLDATDPAALEQFDAARLFVERAQLADRSFRLTADNSTSVAEICVRLEGLPLAIELAATRLALLSPAELLARLDTRLALLTDGSRDLPPRHRALRSTLSWSYDLLVDRERELFARLGVFAGGLTLDAAERVTEATIDEIGALVDASLVRRAEDRFGMLETIREFALEQLVALGLEDEARMKHAAYFEAVAAKAEADEHTDPRALHQRLVREVDNFRAALDHLASDPNRQLELIARLEPLWQTSLAEGQTHLQAALDASSERNELRARALALLTRIAGERGELPLARAAAEEAASLWDELGEPARVVEAFGWLRWAYIVAGDHDGAYATANKALELAGESGNLLSIVNAEQSVLHVLIQQHDLETFDRLAIGAGEHVRELGDPGWQIHFDRLVAEAELIRRRPAKAAGGFQKRLALLRSTSGDRTQMAFEVEGIAMATAGVGDDERAFRLAGAAQTEFEACGFVLDGLRVWPLLKASYLDPARARLGDEAACGAWQQGRSMAFDDAVAEALEVRLLPPSDEVSSR